MNDRLSCQDSSLDIPDDGELYGSVPVFDKKPCELRNLGYHRYNKSMTENTNSNNPEKISSKAQSNFLKFCLQYPEKKEENKKIHLKYTNVINKKDSSNETQSKIRFNLKIQLPTGNNISRIIYSESVAKSSRINASDIQEGDNFDNGSVIGYHEKEEYINLKVKDSPFYRNQ